MRVYMSEDLTTLRSAPVGLCLDEKTGEVLMKTEYGDNDGKLDIYIVSSGERCCSDVDITLVKPLILT